MLFDFSIVYLCKSIASYSLANTKRSPNSPNLLTSYKYGIHLQFVTRIHGTLMNGRHFPVNVNDFWKCLARKLAYTYLP